MDKITQSYNLNCSGYCLQKALVPPCALDRIKQDDAITYLFLVMSSRQSSPSHFSEQAIIAKLATVTDNSLKSFREDLKIELAQTFF